MAKQVMDIQNSHGISQGESDENQRNWSEKQWENRLQQSNRNYDYTRRNLNFEIADGKVQKIDTSKSIDQKMREMCAVRGMRWPNDPNPRRKPGDDDSKVKERNVAACFIFEGSRERMHEIAFGGYGVVDLSKGADNSHVQRSPEIEQWALDTYNWVGRKFGYENIAGFYVHLDETNPHIHCDVLPVAMVKGKERVSYNKVFGDTTKIGNQQKWRAFHDSYYSEVGSKWGLERGDDIQVTGAKHRTYEQYQEDLRKDIKQAETRVKGLTSMVHNLENRQNDLQVEISYLEHDVDVNQEAIDEKTQELLEVQSQLSDKTAKLKDAEQKLQSLKKEIASKNDEVFRLSASISDLKNVLQELQEEKRTLSTKVKGLTTMIFNLKKQVEDLQNSKDSSEEELQEVLKKLTNKQSMLAKATVDLLETMNTINTLSDEVAQLEEKRVSLKEGAANLVGAQLSSWGDSISRKFKGKDDEIREETQEKIMRDMTQISGQWQDGKIPTPEEYARNYKNYKDKARRVAQLEEENKKLQEKINHASAGSKAAANQAYSDGVKVGKQEVQDKMNRVQNVLFDMWPSAKSAVDAIVAKSDSSTSRWLSPLQAEAIFNSMRNCAPDEREDAARDLIELSRNGISRGHEDWLEQTAEEVLNIAENFAQLAILFAVPVQGADVYTTGGGGGGNNDLPKKRDDDWGRRLQAILQPVGGFKKRR